MLNLEASPVNCAFTALHDAENAVFSRTSQRSNASFYNFDDVHSLPSFETLTKNTKEVQFQQTIDGSGSVKHRMDVERWANWLSNLWNRTFQTCNSYTLSFFIIVTLATPCIAFGAAVILSQKGFMIHHYCDFKWPATQIQNHMKLTPFIGATVLIPISNYAITCAIGLSIGLMCTKSRKRVMRAASMGQIVSLASTFMLPCYELIWYTLAAFAFVGICVSVASFSIYPLDKSEFWNAKSEIFYRQPWQSKGFIVQSRAISTENEAMDFPCDYAKLPQLWILQILPMLMVQRCVSRQAVQRALALSGIPVCLMVICYTTLTESYANLLTVIVIAFYAFLFGLCVWTKFIVRVRCTFDFYFLIASIDCVWNIAVDGIALTQLLDPWSAAMLSLQNISLFFRALIVLSFLLSLRADTQYWLGIDDEFLSLSSASEIPTFATHGPIPSSRKARARFVRAWMQQLSERGLITNCSTQTSVFNVHQMIEEHRKNVIDFTSLQLEKIVAHGATAVVMRGVLYNTTAISVKNQMIQCRQQRSPWRGVDRSIASGHPHHLRTSRQHEHLHTHLQDRRTASIALKIYLSVQVTDDELYRFSRETALNGQLCHPNIVYFYGLCVIPPLISLVFEYCDGGSLDVALKVDGQRWSLSRKLQCWLNACRAVTYLHSFSPPLLHRDIKTDNFLLDKFGVLKLTDFGEANILRPRSDGTMTITGTVDFMAPEMIIGGKTARYDTAVDVYSLMITLWQILIPEESPWGKKTHLEVYHAIVLGDRPPLPISKISARCASILSAGWAPNPSDRISVEEILPRVEQLWLLSLHQKPLKRMKASYFRAFR